ncbi:butyrophilin subfamily 2 member A1-like [Rhincodon typus]|uniref:butyrophilin subfamily 2 member A1-like n=1 Tax=Rhincodon typus TaxID=259920 RepID=UPI00202E023E|nr:butyrophilin subfamily 2 member A1-like [Rhincodon typus]
MSWRSLIPLLLILRSSVNGKFIVITSKEPVVVTVGQDVVLECQLIPAEAPEEMEVRWFRKDWNSVVHMYRKGKDEPKLQMKDYSGRTALFHEHFANGNISLLLKNISVKDNGTFRCFVISKAEDAEGSVELKVGSVGLQPVMKMAGYKGNRIKLACASDDWFPEPSIEWWNSKGDKLPGVSKKPVKDARGLLKAESSLTVGDSSDNVYKCTITNTLLKTERKSTLQISGEFFPVVSGWLVAFWIIFVILLGAIGVVLYFYRKQQRQRSLMRELIIRPTIGEYETLSAKLNQANVCAEKEKKNLLKQIENERQAAKLEYKKLLHQIEWDKMLRCAASVTLDPDTANGNLDVSLDHLAVKDGGGWRNVTENPKRFERYPFVVASEAFQSGKHYWEVEVGDSNNWDLGVARGSVRRSGRIDLDEENGYWVIGRYWDKYEVKNAEKTELILSKKPTKVGVFLNWEEGLVSFHNADTKSQLHVFRTHFEEEIFPFFCPWRSQEPLRITPVTLEN